MKTLIQQLGLAAALLVSSSVANAALVATFTESGTDVILTLSGSIDTSGLIPKDTPNTSAGNLVEIIPGQGQLLFFGNPGFETYNRYFVDIQTTNYGSGSYTSTSATSSMLAGLVNFTNFTPDKSDDYPLFLLATSYTSNSAITGSATFSNATFTSLGLTSGSYIYNILDGEDGTASDTFTVNVGSPSTVSVVPLPAGAPLILSALAGLGWLNRRHKLQT